MTTLMEWLAKATDPNETKTSYICPSSDGGLIAGDRYRLHYVAGGGRLPDIPPAYALPRNIDNELAGAFDDMRKMVKWGEEYAINRTDVTMYANAENIPYAKLPEGFTLWRRWADAMSIVSNPRWRQADALFITPGKRDGVVVWRVKFSRFHYAYLIAHGDNGIRSLHIERGQQVTDPRTAQRLERMAQLNYRADQITFDVTDPRHRPRSRAAQLAKRIEVAIANASR